MKVKGENQAVAKTETIKKRATYCLVPGLLQGHISSSGRPTLGRIILM